MHRHITLWRATGVLLLLVLLALPAAAARHRSSRRTRIRSRHQVQRVTRTRQARVVVRSRRTRTVRRTHTRTIVRRQHSRVATRHRRARAQRTAKAAPTAAQANTYTVRRGDTIASVAKRLGASQVALLRANHLPRGHRLAAGQVLRVPGPVQVASAADTCDGTAVVHDALAYRGVPYRYAGTTSRGIDCSGLVSRVLQAHGIRAPHNAASLSQMGTPVHYGELKPGDLVFFNTRGYVSHVGMYIGDNKFVHASSGSGYVTVTSLSEKYYQNRLVCARRLLKN